jgi:hypothetical protein
MRSAACPRHAQVYAMVYAVAPGDVVSVTVTANVPLAVLPAGSVAVQRTVVEALGSATTTVASCATTDHGRHVPAQ